MPTEEALAEDRPAVATGEAGRLEFREAMARLAAAVTIVTTDGPGGRAGFTASAVTSVTDRPPTLLVCLNRASSAFPAVHANGVVCINVLGADDKGLSQLFGGGTPAEERFFQGRWTRMETGAPALESALSSLDCRIASTVTAGTHDVLLCEVQAIRRAASGEALAYFNKNFHRLKDG